MKILDQNSIIWLPKFWFLTIFSMLDQTTQLLHEFFPNISILVFLENVDFDPKFWFFVKIPIFV